MGIIGNAQKKVDKYLGLEQMFRRVFDDASPDKGNLSAYFDVNL